MREFVIGTGTGRRPWLVFFVPGLILLVFGVLILVVPELLVALVAAFCIGCGLLLASVGWRLRQGPPRGPMGGWPGMFDPRG